MMIRGVVYNADGSPVTGVTVQLDEPVADDSLNSTKELFISVETDDEGNFSLIPHRPGLHTLVVVDAQHCPVWVQNVPSGKQDVAIRMDPVPVICGRVLVHDDYQQIPLAGIEVRASLDDLGNPLPNALSYDRITVTDQDGYFRFRGLGATLRDGRVHMSPGLALTSRWRIECAHVGDTITIRPTDREVDVKLVLSKDAHNQQHRLVSCTRTIQQAAPLPLGL